MQINHKRSQNKHSNNKFSLATVLLSLLLPLSITTAQAEEIILDNGTATFSVTGTWPTSTSVTGYEGSNYQHHTAGTAGSPNGTMVDNSDAGFSVTDTWPNSTSVTGYNGSNYQVHTANSGAPANATIIDNLNANNTTVGTWNNSASVTGYEATNYQTNAAGTGADIFTWVPTITTATQYDVYAKWTSHGNRASNAKYTVNHSTGSDTLTVNQKTNGGTWQLLGTYTLDTNSNITLNDDADGYVIADAIQLLPTGEPPAPPVANTATWNATLATTGDYEVYARWTAHNNRASNAAYTINHSAGSSTVTTNQKTNGATWNLLGTYTFNAGAASVSLTDIADGYVIADAVIFSPVGSGTSNNTNTATWTPALTAAKEYEVYAKWSAHPNRATNASYTINHTSGSNAVTVNQKLNGGIWNLLGTYTLDASSTITLNDQADGYVIADGIRLVGADNPGPTTPQAYFIHTDHLNTPRLITDAGNNKVWEWEINDPFGNNAQNADPSSTGSTFTYNPRLPGQYFDAETQLSYNYFRDYDASIGRYLQSDPIGLAGGINTYGYVNGNPLWYTDPEGLRSVLTRPITSRTPGLRNSLTKALNDLTLPDPCQSHRAAANKIDAELLQITNSLGCAQKVVYVCARVIKQFSATKCATGMFISSGMAISENNNNLNYLACEAITLGGKGCTCPAEEKDKLDFTQ